MSDVVFTSLVVNAAHEHSAGDDYSNAVADVDRSAGLRMDVFGREAGGAGMRLWRVLSWRLRRVIRCLRLLCSPSRRGLSLILRIIICRLLVLTRIQ